MESVVSIAGSWCFFNYYANWAGIAQKQDLFNINFKTNCHRYIYMISISTFAWSRTEIGYDINESIKC